MTEGIITADEMNDLRAYTLLKPDIVWTLAQELMEKREIDMGVVFSASYPLFLQEKKKYAKDIKKMRETCKEIVEAVIKDVQKKEVCPRSEDYIKNCKKKRYDCKTCGKIPKEKHGNN
jgi:hypothetical protein